MIDPAARPCRAPWWHAATFVTIGALAGGGVAYAATPRGSHTASVPTTSRAAAPTSTTGVTVAPSSSTTGPPTTTTDPSTAPTTVPATTTTSVAPPTLPTTAPPPSIVPTSAVPDAASGVGPVDPQHPCAALTAAEVAAATRTDGLLATVADQRCRYRAPTGADRAVVTVAGYPSAGVARNGLRDVRRTLADTARATCTRADAGDEALVCEPTLGPVATVGLVRVGATVVRVDLFGAPPMGAVALLLERAATRL